MSVTTDTAPPSPATATSQEALHALLCDLLPPQGAWSDDAYLWLTDSSNRLIEFTDGYVEELPIPTFTHQSVLAFLYDLFRAYLQPRGGVVVFAALRLRVRPGKFREPDLLLLRDRTDRRCQDRFWEGADLVVEVVSPDDPDRDLVEKRADYAGPASRSTGSPTRATRRFACCRCAAPPTSSTACIGAATRQLPRSSPASPPK